MGVEAGSNATCATLGSCLPTGSSNLASTSGVGSCVALLPSAPLKTSVPFVLAAGIDPFWMLLVLAAPLLEILAPG